MPVPSLITDLSQTPLSNYPDGSESPNTADDYFRTHAAFIAMLRDGEGFSDPVTLASATTTDIGAQASMFVDVSGTTTITGFGTNYEGPRFLRFTGALTLTHNATTLNLPGAANITTAAGDTCIAIPNITPNGWNVVHYQLAANAPGVATSAATVTTTIASGATGTTQSPGDNSTKIATTAYADAAAGSASTTVAGIVELATDAETLTGTDTTRAVTPSNLGATLGLVKLASGTLSSVASLAIVMTAYTAFTNKRLVLTNVKPVTDATALWARYSTNGGSSYDDSASNYGYVNLQKNTAGTDTSAQGAATALVMCTGVGSGATEGVSGVIDIFGTTSTSEYTRQKHNLTVVDSTGAFSNVDGVGGRAAAQDTDAYQVLFSSGNIASGSWVLYGWN